MIEDKDGKVTDMCSYYHLPSSVIGNDKHATLYAAYSFYNIATTVPLTELMDDCLTLAKRGNFDVFNALDIMENGTFLKDLKFGIGDGHLQVKSNARRHVERMVYTVWCTRRYICFCSQVRNILSHTPTCFPSLFRCVHITSLVNVCFVAHLSPALSPTSTTSITGAASRWFPRRWDSCCCRCAEELE